MTAHEEVIEAALSFVASTSVFRQPRECREQFERLALAALAFDAYGATASERIRAARKAAGK